MEESMGLVKEDRDDLAPEKNAKRVKEEKWEREKDRLRAFIRVCATGRGSLEEGCSGDDIGDAAGADEGQRVVCGRRVRKRCTPTIDMEEEVEYVEAFDHADKTQIEMEGKKLALAQLQFEEDREERKWGREERREGREVAAYFGA